MTDPLLNTCWHVAALAVAFAAGLWFAGWMGRAAMVRRYDGEGLTGELEGGER